MARGVYSTSNYFLYTGSLVTATPVTMAAWNYVSTIGHSSLISIGYNSGAGTTIDGWVLRNIASTGLLYAEAGTGAATSPAASSASVNTGAWNHEAGVFASNTSRYAYLNGVQSAQNTTSRVPSATPNFAAIGIRINQDNSKSFAGQYSVLADVGIWNVALTSGEILQLSLGYSPLYVRPESLIAYYPLIRGDASGDEPDLMAGAKMVEQGTVAVAVHPRIFLPSRPQFIRLGAGTDALTATNITTAAPTVASPTIGQKHALTSTSITTAAPVFSAPTLGVSGVTYALTATNISTSAPVLDAPELNKPTAVPGGSPFYYPMPTQPTDDDEDAILVILAALMEKYG